jgi:TRAP-type C4-dicarboxylate transport system permease small subunit
MIAGISTQILVTVGQVAGLMATLGGVIIGVRVVYGAMMGSPRSLSEGITALLVAAFGICLIVGGPTLADYIYKNVGATATGIQIPSTLK